MCLGFQPKHNMNVHWKHKTTGGMASPPGDSLGEHEQPAARIAADGNRDLRTRKGGMPAVAISTFHPEARQGERSLNVIGERRLRSVRANIKTRRINRFDDRSSFHSPVIWPFPIHRIAPSHCRVSPASVGHEQSRRPLEVVRGNLGDISGLGVRSELICQEALARPNTSNTPTPGIPIKSHHSFGWSSNVILTRGYHPPHPIPSLALWDGVKPYETGYKPPIRGGDNNGRTRPAFADGEGATRQTIDAQRSFPGWGIEDGDGESYDDSVSDNTGLHVGRRRAGRLRSRWIDGRVENSSTLLGALGPLPLSSDPSARFTDAPTCPVVEHSSRLTSPFEEFYALVLMSIGRRVRRMLSPARLSNTVNGTGHVNLRGGYNL
ncbi:hypothetical protein FA13DRAFT_1718558 [Coprinellus micaceus]|uniref:Uncharacterized protein n=1 Tax=Coprinellus micaceus TaxID=71717 RepID=A0A4Y7SDJ5_COPMI|nr:hypothetical protein FA13DRAFT_1718558 [Coprinellus micaceus]